MCLCSTESAKMVKMKLVYLLLAIGFQACLITTAKGGEVSLTNSIWRWEDKWNHSPPLYSNETYLTLYNDYLTLYNDNQKTEMDITCSDKNTVLNEPVILSCGDDTLTGTQLILTMNYTMAVIKGLNCTCTDSNGLYGLRYIFDFKEVPTVETFCENKEFLMIQRGIYHYIMVTPWESEVLCGCKLITQGNPQVFLKLGENNSTTNVTRTFPYAENDWIVAKNCYAVYPDNEERILSAIYSTAFNQAIIHINGEPFIPVVLSANPKTKIIILEPYSSYVNFTCEHGLPNKLIHFRAYGMGDYVSVRDKPSANYVISSLTGNWYANCFFYLETKIYIKPFNVSFAIDGTSFENGTEFTYNEGDMINLNCSIDTYSNYLDPDFYASIDCAGNNTRGAPASVTIEANRTMDGEFCSCSDTERKTVDAARINVQFPATDIIMKIRRESESGPTVIPEGGSMDLKEAINVSFHCQAVGGNPFTNNFTITCLDTKIESFYDVIEAVMNFTVPSTLDGKSCICAATHISVSNPTYKYTLVTVEEKITNVTMSIQGANYANMTVFTSQVGSVVNVTCSPNGWTYGLKLVCPGNQQTAQQPSLNITLEKNMNLGKCRCMDEIEGISSYTTLNVLYKPMIEIENCDANNTYLRPDENIGCDCVIKEQGNPPVTVRWTDTNGDGSNSTSSVRLNITNTGSVPSVSHQCQVSDGEKTWSRGLMGVNFAYGPTTVSVDVVGGNVSVHCNTSVNIFITCSSDAVVPGGTASLHLVDSSTTIQPYDSLGTDWYFNVSSQDSGEQEMRCIVTNTLYQDINFTLPFVQVINVPSNDIQMKLKRESESGLTVISEGGSIDLKEGTHVSFHCQAIGGYPLTTNFVITCVDTKIESFYDVTEAVMNLTVPSTLDGKSCICAATHISDCGPIYVSTMVTVQEKITDVTLSIQGINYANQSVFTSEVGSVVNVTCSPNGWTNGLKLVCPSDQQTAQQPSLNITLEKNMNLGECQCMDEIEGFSSYTTLDVLYQPIIEIENCAANNTYLRPEENIGCDCVVKEQGNPPVTVRWTDTNGDGSNSTSSVRLNITNTGSVPSVSHQCLVSNGEKTWSHGLMGVNFAYGPTTVSVEVIGGNVSVHCNTSVDIFITCSSDAVVPGGTATLHLVDSSTTLQPYDLIGTDWYFNVSSQGSGELKMRCIVTNTFYQDINITLPFVQVINVPPQDIQIKLKRESESGPTVIPEGGSIDLKEGTDVSFHCQVVGGYPLAYDFAITCGNLNTMMLAGAIEVVKNFTVTSDLNGTQCVCQAYHISGCSIPPVSTMITVHEKITNLTLSIQGVNYANQSIFTSEVGSVVNVTCSPNGWTNGLKLVCPGNQQTAQQPSLSITLEKNMNLGECRCVDEIEGITSYTTLDVLYQPLIQIEKCAANNTYLRPEENIGCDCVVKEQGNPPVTVRWTDTSGDGSNSTSSVRLNITNTGSVPSVSHQCLVSDGEKTWSHGSMGVNFPYGPTTVSVEVGGGNISARCNPNVNIVITCSSDAVVPGGTASLHLVDSSTTLQPYDSLGTDWYFNVSSQDSGELKMRCIVKNTFYQDINVTMPFLQVINVPPQEIQIKLRRESESGPTVIQDGGSIVLKEATDVSLHCQAVGGYPLTNNFMITCGNLIPMMLGGAIEAVKNFTVTSALNGTQCVCQASHISGCSIPPVSTMITVHEKLTAVAMSIQGVNHDNQSVFTSEVGSVVSVKCSPNGWTNGLKLICPGDQQTAQQPSLSITLEKNMNLGECRCMDEIEGISSYTTLDVLYKPIIEIENCAANNTYLRPEENIGCDCVVQEQGNPLVTVRWTDTSGDGSNSTSSVSLNITNTGSELSTSHQCLVSDGKQSWSHGSMDVKFTYGPSRTSLEVTGGNVHSRCGQSLDLLIQCTSDLIIPNAVMELNYGGTIIEPLNSTQVSDNMSWWFRVASTDSGPVNIGCMVKNGIFQDLIARDNSLVTIIVPPSSVSMTVVKDNGNMEVIQDGTSLRLAENKTVDIKCQTTGGYPLNSEIVLRCGQGTNTENGTTNSLELTATSDLNATECTCSVDHVSQCGAIVTTSTIFVETIPTMTFNIENRVDFLEVEQGTDISFQCSVRYNPQPDISIVRSRDETRLDLDSAATQRSTFVFDVNQQKVADCEDAGTYVCVAEVEQNTVITSSSVELSVLCPPRILENNQESENIFHDFNNALTRIILQIVAKPIPTSFSLFRLMTRTRLGRAVGDANNDNDARIRVEVDSSTYTWKYQAGNVLPYGQIMVELVTFDQDDIKEFDALVGNGFGEGNRIPFTVNMTSLQQVWSADDSNRTSGANEVSERDLIMMIICGVLAFVVLLFLLYSIILMYNNYNKKPKPLTVASRGRPARTPTAVAGVMVADTRFNQPPLSWPSQSHQSSDVMMGRGHDIRRDNVTRPTRRGDFPSDVMAASRTRRGYH